MGKKTTKPASVSVTTTSKGDRGEIDDIFSAAGGGVGSRTSTFTLTDLGKSASVKASGATKSKEEDKNIVRMSQKKEKKAMKLNDIDSHMPPQTATTTTLPSLGAKAVQEKKEKKKKEKKRKRNNIENDDDPQPKSSSTSSSLPSSSSSSLSKPNSSSSKPNLTGRSEKKSRPENKSKSSQKNRPTVQIITDTSDLTQKLSQPNKSITSSGGVDMGFKKNNNVMVDDDLDEFMDSRGRSSKRKRTEDGLRIFTVEELGLGKGNGDTKDCPFDCQCCF